MMDTYTWFGTPGPITEAGQYSYLLDDLPTEIGELCRIVQCVTIHIFWAKRYGLELPDIRHSEVQLRTLQPRLARTIELDAHPLTHSRSLEKKLVGNCRDFSLLLVSILRHKGIPARARCGFGAYFIAGHYEDHWVAEYWDEAQKRWILVDAQLDPFQCDALKIPFDPLDVPRDQFIVGGRAWQMCRRDEADPESFGIFDMKGLDFVRGNLIRDVASLNKVELLPWDCWGLIDKAALDNPADLACLDSLAELTCADVPDFKAVRALYLSDSRLLVDGNIHSFTAVGLETVQVPI
jgi:hypothetical protein